MGRIADESLILLRLGLSASATDEEKALVDLSLRLAEGDIARHLGYDPVQAARTEYYPVGEATPPSLEDAVWEANASVAYLRRSTRGAANELPLRHLPLRRSGSDGSTNLLAVRIDYDGRFGTKSGSFASDTAKTEGTDFWANYDGLDAGGIQICRDGILRSAGLWPIEPGSIRVTYLGGYSAAEFNGQSSLVDASPILDAVVEEACRRVETAMLRKKKSGAGWTAGPITSERLGDYSYSTGAGSQLVNTLYGGGYAILPEVRERLSQFVNWSRAL